MSNVMADYSYPAADTAPTGCECCNSGGPVVPCDPMWLSGDGPPDPEVGIDGQYYVDLDTNDVYFRVDGEWVYVFTLGGEPTGEFTFRLLDTQSVGLSGNIAAPSLPVFTINPTIAVVNNSNGFGIVDITDLNDMQLVDDITGASYQAIAADPRGVVTGRSVDTDALVVWALDLQSSTPVDVPYVAGLVLDGDVLFVASEADATNDPGEASVRAFDVSDWSTPVELDDVALHAVSAVALGTTGTRLYGASWDTGELATWDVSDPSDIVELDVTDWEWDGVYDLMVQGDWLYVLFHSGSDVLLGVHDISTGIPAPTGYAVLGTTGMDARQLFPLDTWHIGVLQRGACSGDDLIAVNIADKTDPAAVATFESSEFDYNGAAARLADGNLFIVSGLNNIAVLDFYYDTGD